MTKADIFEDVEGYRYVRRSRSCIAEQVKSLPEKEPFQLKDQVLNAAHPQLATCNMHL